ncbi:trace amine-associated receptor 13c-like [Erpetoichthys calabaricus]|uniref:trace amine-associated receptor 13c-like n=1 Tax=Erpetoichthys calabaricus TaxID=27687 RepID=UPI002234433B|nr:trace amine-associated receptor 13c-like [Erpetoichthys calabaricus]
MDGSYLKSQQLVQYCYPHDNRSCLREIRLSAVYGMLYILSALSVMLTVVGNLLVVISVSHFKQLHTPSNLLVLSLAAADFLIGIFLMPFNISKIIENCWYFGDRFCFFNALVDYTLTSVSVSNLIFIAIDRYVAICDPLLYSAKITVPIVQLFIMTNWIFAMVYTWAVFFFKRYYISFDSVSVCVGDCQGFYAESWVLMEFIIMFFIPCAVMASLYSKIFLVARRHLKIINSVNQQICTKELHQNKRPKNSERKAAKTLGIVISVYFICWVPFYTCKIIYTYTTLPVPNVFFNVLVWLIYFNSGMNPIIYALFYPWFKKSVKLIMTLKICNLESSLINLFSVNN